MTRLPVPPTLRVLVVDDSAVVRQALTAILSREPDLTVTTAADPLIALERIRAARPDCIVLDLEMPRMDGLTFLRALAAEIPVVVCSGQAGRGSETALRALEEGAVEIVAKPRAGVRDFLYESAVTLVDAVRAAVAARRGCGASSRAPGAVTPARRDEGPPSDAVVAIGASTGGTEALREILSALPADAPGIVAVQHMPAGFTAQFARRLDRACRLAVHEARDGDVVRRGVALVAPGDRHLVVQRRDGQFEVRVRDGPLVSRHRPSVDVLFDSVAAAAGHRAVGVILTGMGADGARGLGEMHARGAATIAQDQATSVVFGMPQEAIARGVVDEVVPLGGIAAAILRRTVPLRGV